MTLKTEVFEGDIFTDSKGQWREVVKVMKYVVKFEMKRQGTHRYPSVDMKTGEQRWMGKVQFLGWAKERIA